MLRYERLRKQLQSMQHQRLRKEIDRNADLFKKIKAVYETRNDSDLDDQQIRVTEKYYEDFERNGANLSVEDQEILKGNGYGLEAPRQAIEIVHNVRHAAPIGAKGDYHPFVLKPLAKHPFNL